MFNFSFITYFITQKIEANLYAALKDSSLAKYFIVRNYASMIITQFIDTVLFTFLGLWGIIGNMWHIIIVAYMIKLITIIFAVIAVSVVSTIVVSINIKRLI